MSLSQSRFAARIVAILGEPLMFYVEKLRMYIARKLLEHGLNAVTTPREQLVIEKGRSVERPFICFEMNVHFQGVLPETGTPRIEVYKV